MERKGIKKGKSAWGECGGISLYIYIIRILIINTLKLIFMFDIYIYRLHIIYGMYSPGYSDS